MRADHEQLLHDVRQAATERFIAALPPDDRQVLAWVAQERGMRPVQMIAGMIADEIAVWEPQWRARARGAPPPAPARAIGERARSRRGVS